MSKIKVVALFGKSGAGKDTVQRYLIDAYPNDAKGIVSCTTRPKRDYEQYGVDYHYLTTEKFAEKVLNGEMLEATEFNDWFYGTSITELDPEKINVGVFNPTGVEALIGDSRLDVLPIEIIASDKTRLLRALNREDSPNCSEICRRFFADEEDFCDLDDLGDFYTISNDEEGGFSIFMISVLENLFEDFMLRGTDVQLTSN